MYLALSAHSPFLVHSATHVPVRLIAGQDESQIQYLQKGHLFPSLWVSLSGSPLAPQAQGMAGSEPDRPPAASAAPGAGGTAGQKMVPSPTAALAPPRVD